jgi:hypothetical protein
MSIKLNSSGMPQGTGSLQVRGRVWWAIYTDETGRKLQVNTGTDDLIEARRVLARTALAVEREIVAALERIANEATTREPAAGSRRNHSAARDSRSRANGKEPAKAAGAGGTYPRQRGARKGEAA